MIRFTCAYCGDVFHLKTHRPGTVECCPHCKMPNDVDRPLDVRAARGSRAPSTGDAAGGGRHARRPEPSAEEGGPADPQSVGAPEVKARFRVIPLSWLVLGGFIVCHVFMSHHTSDRFWGFVGAMVGTVIGYFPFPVLVSGLFFYCSRKSQNAATLAFILTAFLEFVVYQAGNH